MAEKNLIRNLLILFNSELTTSGSSRKKEQSHFPGPVVSLTLTTAELYLRNAMAGLIGFAARILYLRVSVSMALLLIPQ